MSKLEGLNQLYALSILVLDIIQENISKVELLCILIGTVGGICLTTVRSEILICLRQSTAKACAKDVFIDYGRKLGYQSGLGTP